MNTFLCLVLMTGGAHADDKPFSAHSDEGYVPDSKTACKITEAIWIPMHGEKQIESEKPFVATLENGIWTVVGTFNLPRGYNGGVSLIEIRKDDCKILRYLTECRGKCIPGTVLKS